MRMLNKSILISILYLRALALFFDMPVQYNLSLCICKTLPL
jgi:hypothetical protein